MSTNLCDTNSYDVDFVYRNFNNRAKQWICRYQENTNRCHTLHHQNIYLNGEKLLEI